MTNPTALITSQQLTRHALTGALADDPVLPERAGRPPRRLRVRLTRSHRRTR